jgi:UDP-glucose 4-epimerase
MNAATGSRITLNEVFRLMCELTGYSGDPAYGPPRSGDIRDSLAAIGLAEQLMGYRPKVDLREGLRRTLDWYRTAS